MEYVGRRVKKKFQGHGTFFGLVQAYEPATGFFKIVYDDGDSEELELMEVSSLLVSDEPLPESSAEKPGRQPKRRRRIVSEGTTDNSLVNEGLVCDNLVVKDGELDLNLNDGASNCLRDGDHEGNAVGGGAKLHDLDLNEGVTLELDEGLCLNEEIIVECQGEKKEIIDLNLDVNGDLNDVREGRRFDLNLQLVEDEVKILDNYEGQVGANERVFTGSRMQIKEEMVENDRMGNSVSMDEDKADLIVNKETEADNQLKKCATAVDNENVAPVSVQPKKRGRKRKTLPNANTELATSQAPTVDFESEKMDLELERRDGTPSINNGDSVCHDNGNSESVVTKRRGRKRRELSENDNTLTTPDTGLRRSSRRAKQAALSGEDLVSNAAVLECISHQLSSPAISIVSDEKITVAALKKSSEDVVLSPKVELPPPSCNLNFDGVSLFDFLSIYTFLRSFSTLLFLSPFGLDDFVASVKSNDSSLLFDSAHVSLLRTLRKHLECLSVEGSDSASDCLRSLNWDFLDLITWPMFVVEYLLFYRPGYIPGLDLSQLKLYQDDYYKLPISSKIEIMRHLCDDVIETEAFRSELNRRMLVSDRQIDLERNLKYDGTKRRKSAVDVASTSCITEEDAEERADSNIDECCLCKMDGNLICCDGCPAAYHSRCVGIVSSLLPEGDWYCPECAVEKDKPWMKVSNKAIRGAELLDIDPYGRLYYSCYGYLLVLESCDEKSSCCAYSRNDLPTLIEVLESSPIIYSTLINAICKNWNVVRGTRNDLDTRSCSIQSAFPGKKQLPDMHLTPSEPLNRSEVFSEKRSNGKTGNNGLNMENQLASSEGSPEVSQTFMKTDNLKDSVLDQSKVCPEISDCHIVEKLVNAGDDYVIETFVNTEKGTNYVNCYEFARTAALYYEELTTKSLIKTPEDAQRSIEEIIAGQLKVVSNRFAQFSWSNIQNSVVNFRKERCGWCVYCRAAEDERDCLFCMNDSFPAVESFTCEALGIQSRKNLKSHLIDVMCHIICIEDHLQGLLVGPWLNPGYSMMWRRSVLEMSDIASLKNLLLELESNLHHRVISVDWKKHVDSVATMGSASHIVSTSARASSKYGTGRKRAKSSEVSGPSSNAATGLSSFWWRGGRGSRALFNWKVLPRSLACKAARQGGRKIPDILYPDSGEYAKRTKFASWRAAIETSRSVEQLALQIREFDANIRWDDIGNTNLLSKIEKDSKKPVRSFKKVIVRRKCSEGTMVKYLLDFGKRRFIPEVVVKHGSRVEDSSSDKKKFWLEESHVPLYLLKGFEEKRIARKSNNMKPAKLCVNSRFVRKSFQEKGFSYLFSRAEKSDKCQCEHCKKDVLIREAVSCQHCKGFFHKRHVRKSAGSITTECKYTCHKCQDGGFVKINARKGKYEPPKLKNSSKGMKLLGPVKGKKRGRPLSLKNKKRVPVIIPLRRSARNAERTAKLTSQKTKTKKRKKGKKAKSEKGKFMKPKPKPKPGSWKKTRTPVMSSYWLNGLRFSRLPDDERLMHFRSRLLLVLSGEGTSICDKPKCSLCNELEYKSELNYVCCEICGDWFHGDALNLRADKIENLIGFKCYMCLKKRPPVCPHHCSTGSTKLSENKTKTETTGEDSDCLTHPEDESALNGNSKDANVSVNMEKQLPEEVQKDDDFKSSEKILLENGPVKLDERKGELLNAVEIQSTVPNSDMIEEHSGMCS